MPGETECLPYRIGPQKIMSMESAPYTVKPFVDIHGDHHLRVPMDFPDSLTEGTKHTIRGNLWTE